MCAGLHVVADGDFLIAEGVNDALVYALIVDADTDRVYGQLTNVDRPAAQDIYTVTDGAGEEHMLPAVPEFVKKIDIDARKIFVTPIEGMFTDAVNGDED